MNSSGPVNTGMPHMGPNPNASQGNSPTRPEGNPPTGINQNEISKEKVQEIVLNHANLKAEDVSYWYISKDFDDGIMEYEVEFYVDNKEYSYSLNANTGDIIEFEVENN